MGRGDWGRHRSRRCCSRTGSEPRETANRALRSGPGGQMPAARQVGGEKQTKQVSETAKRAAMRPEGGYVDELDTRGRRAHGFSTETKLISIPSVRIHFP